MIIDRRENIERINSLLQKQPWTSEVKVLFDSFDCREGEVILRIYDRGSTQKLMLEELRKYTWAPRTVTFGIKEGECDVVIPDAGGGHLAKELKKRYSPVSLRGWRNIIHF